MTSKSPFTSDRIEACKAYINREAKTRAGGPSLIEALKILGALSEHMQDAGLQAIAPLCGNDTVQQAWSTWSHETDREELRLRLECLQHVETVSASLNDLLFFFFRSSDPVLYQAAARVIGRHLHADTERWQRVQHYAQAQSIALDQPVQLNGRRARRRVLVMAAAHHARATPPMEDIAYPVELDSPHGYVKHEAADVRVLLQAMHILRAAPHSGWRKAARTFVQDIAAGDGPPLDPLLVRPWALVETSSHTEGQALAASPWPAFLQRVAEAQADSVPSFSTAARHLRLIDEAMKGLARRAETSAEAVRALLNGVKLRHNEFAHRRYMVARDRLEHGTARLAWRAAAKRMVSPVQWTLADPEERAEAAFTLLDASRFLPSDEYEAFTHLLDALDIGSASIFNDSSALPGAMRGATVRLLLHLRKWEASGDEGVLDPRLVHQVGAFEVLIDLVPNDVSDESAAIFADAIENQLRSYIATASDPRPEHKVYALAARAPYALLFEEIADVCHGREYLTAEGDPVALEALIRAFAPQSLAQEAAIRESAVHAADSSFGEALQGVRRALQNVQEMETPTAAVAGWVALMVRQDQSDGASASVYAFVRRVYGASADASLRVQAAQTVAELQAQRSHLTLQTLSDAPALQDAAQTVQQEVEAFCTALLPWLAPSEAESLRRARDHLVALLHRWSEAASIRYEQSRKEKDIPVSPLLNAILQQEPGSLRHMLVAATARSAMRSTPSASAFDAALYRTVRHPKALEQATPGERRSWQRVMHEGWEQQERRAMEDGRETEVTALMQAYATQKGTDRPSMKQISEEMEDWLLDRYHLIGAFQARRLRMPQSHWGAWVGGTMMAYLGHFMYVWFALLVGALLMLDFGDAWFAMAEEGDQAGIALTFGLGVVATLGYLFADLRGKVTDEAAYSGWAWLQRTGRLLIFLGVALCVATAYTSGFWYLLSGTEGVVQEGYEAVLSVVVWTSFALFVGVFLGLIAKTDA